MLAVDEDRIVLDRSIFFAEDSVQDRDTGKLLWQGYVARVEDVSLRDDRIFHRVSGPLPQVGQFVRCKINWSRRYFNMRSYSVLCLAVQVLQSQSGFWLHKLALDDRGAAIDYELEAGFNEDGKRIEALITKELLDQSGILQTDLSTDLAQKLNGIPVANRSEIGRVGFEYSVDQDSGIRRLSLILQADIVSQSLL